jgi:hypothetical protein
MSLLRDALEDVGRDQEAIALCESLRPEDSNKEQSSLSARVRLGGAAEVIRFYESDPGKTRNWNVLGCAYARNGRREEAEEAAFHVTGGDSGAEIYACLGDKDRVFEALDRDVPFGPIRVGWFLLRVDREHPGFLAGDPRLQALRKKVGLPQ